MPKGPVLFGNKLTSGVLRDFGGGLGGKNSRFEKIHIVCPEIWI